MCRSVVLSQVAWAFRTRFCQPVTSKPHTSSPPKIHPRISTIPRVTSHVLTAAVPASSARTSCRWHLSVSFSRKTHRPLLLLLVLAMKMLLLPSRYTHCQSHPYILSTSPIGLRVLHILPGTWDLESEIKCMSSQPLVLLCCVMNTWGSLIDPWSGTISIWSSPECDLARWEGYTGLAQGSVNSEIYLGDQ